MTGLQQPDVNQFHIALRRIFRQVLSTSAPVEAGTVALYCPMRTEHRAVKGRSK
jgi:hypothetical protein